MTRIRELHSSLILLDKHTASIIMYTQEQIKPYGDNGSKREQVERMFNNIAHSYDMLNHSLSFGIDRCWRNEAIRFLLKNRTSTENVLDIATGTGDFAIIAHRKLHPKRIVGCDISEGMMDIAREKVKKLGLDHSITFQNEDCSNMSFNDSSFDAVISAFALRNFQNLDKCLQEMHRVLSPGGHLSVVDLCAPTAFPMKQLFFVYKRCIMPAVGRLFSRDMSAYSYLPDTMDAVPQGERMQQIIQQAGFRNVSYKRLVFGMCMLYTAQK